MVTKKDTKECPYCKETVKLDALKCKHCLSKLQVESTSHEGICPFCKEEINPEAVKCKHCKSMLGHSFISEQGTPRTGCGCGCDGVKKQSQLSAVNDLGQLDNGEASIPKLPLAQQQLSFGGFDIRCHYLGPFLGRWCCLYFNGRWINCAEMRLSQQFSQ